MSDLSEFIEARLAEVEALAKAVTVGPEWESALSHRWRTDDAGTDWGESLIYEPGEEYPVTPGGGEHGDDGMSRETAAHIAAHDPAFTLAWVEALRRVVALHVDSQQARRVGQYRDGQWTPYCEHDSEAAPCPTLRALASTWKTHPEWREEWA